VVFAYDGSDLARAAIAEAGRQQPAKRDALVLTVWRTFNVGFVPEPGSDFNAASGDEVREAAEQTAAHGVSIAQRHPERVMLTCACPIDSESQLPGPARRMIGAWHCSAEEDAKNGASTRRPCVTRCGSACSPSAMTT
jgi:hypothetical protein